MPHATVSNPRQAETMEDLDALWAPFKAKRQTRAQQAKSKGLEPLETQLSSEKCQGIVILWLF